MATVKKTKEYNHIAIEKKWQKEWDKKKVYKTEGVSKKPKYYVLDMFPYPSGAGLHVGHPRGYIASDVFARMKRMQGYNVLHPMGYDAFGLPAEQYAIQHKINPSQAVKKNVATFEKQLSIIGLSYDWERRINTTDPEYYKWTQDIFLKIYDSYYDTKKRQARPIAELVKIFEKEGNVKINDFCVHSDTEVFNAKEWKTKNEKEKQDVLMKYRLAYEGYSEVNWCPELGTVLANDEIVEKNGKQVSERGEFSVEKKSMRQWFMRITAYADRLIAGLDTLDWPENIKEIQRNWIGRREEIDGDKVVVRYNMRDAIFARQRYWGEPIPLKHTKDGLIMPLKVKELPLKLPNVKSYEPTGTGDSPLAGVSSWMKAGYETNTMPGWAGSSWYYLRYADPKNKKELASKKSLDYWMKGGVDMYVGGSEHATGHLLYSRFWHKVLKDYGIVQTEEPFRTLKNQGMILGPDHRKMSKRWGNVINPDEIVKTYGADTLRVYEMFMGPFDQMQPWNTESIIGSRRFIEKVWRLAGKVQSINSKKSDENTEKVLHKTIKKVTEDVENFSFNTAVSSMMICMNEIEKTENISTKDFKMFLQISAPFASHAVDELWNSLGEKKSVHLSSWPKYDPKKLIEDKIKIMIQVNSKIRGEMEMSVDATEEEIRSHAERNEKVLPWLEGKEIKKIIYVKGKLINILV